MGFLLIRASIKTYEPLRWLFSDFHLAISYCGWNACIGLYTNNSGNEKVVSRLPPQEERGFDTDTARRNLGRIRITLDPDNNAVYAINPSVGVTISSRTAVTNHLSYLIFHQHSYAPPGISSTLPKPACSTRSQARPALSTPTVRPDLSLRLPHHDSLRDPRLFGDFSHSSSPVL